MQLNKNKRNQQQHTTLTEFSGGELRFIDYQVSPLGELQNSGKQLVALLGIWVNMFYTRDL